MKKIIAVITVCALFLSGCSFHFSITTKVPTTTAPATSVAPVTLRDLTITPQTVDGQEITLVGGSNLDDWSKEVTRAQSIELAREIQTTMLPGHDRVILTHIVVDGVRTELVFDNPDGNTAGLWERFSPEISKFRSVKDGILSLDSQDLALSDATTHADNVRFSECYNSISTRLFVLEQVDPALTGSYMMYIGSFSCGDQGTEIVFYADQSHAAFLREVIDSYASAPGARIVKSIRYDGATKELLVIPREGYQGTEEVFQEIKKAVAKHPEMVRQHASA